MDQAFKLSVKSVPDSDDVMLEFPQPFVEQQGWLAGDSLRWEAAPGGVNIVNESLEKRRAEVASQETPIFIVDKLISVRVRYAVRARCAEHAKDTVTMNEAEEFDQNPIGEDIIGAAEMSEAQFFDQFTYPIGDEAKRRFVHVIDYKT